MQTVEYNPGQTTVDMTTTVDMSLQEMSPMIQILRKVIPIGVAVICILGLVFNGLIIVHIMLWTKVKSLANTFILNLAVADFFFMITFPFLGYQLSRDRWIFGEVLCRVLIPYDSMVQFTVVFFLVVMSLDRYLAFCQPIKSMHFRTITHGRIISIVVWVASIIVTLPIWLFTQHHCQTYPDGSTMCLCLAKVVSGEPSGRISWFTIYSLLLDFCIPLVIICGCYLLILWNLLRNPLKEMSSTSRRASRKITFLVICIVVVFFVCFLPFFIIQFYVSQLDTWNENHSLAYTIGWFLMYSHSVINPVVYTMIGVNFRQNLINFFRQFWRPRASPPNNDKTSSIRLCNSRSSVCYAVGNEHAHRIKNGTGCQYSNMKQFDLKSTEVSGISKLEESL